MARHTAWGVDTLLSCPPLHLLVVVDEYNTKRTYCASTAKKRELIRQEEEGGTSPAFEYMPGTCVYVDVWRERERE